MGRGIVLSGGAGNSVLNVAPFTSGNPFVGWGDVEFGGWGGRARDSQRGVGNGNGVDGEGKGSDSI